jgi:hypothetical protein
MSLVEDNELTEVCAADFADLDAAIARWRDFPASNISHHGADCCEVARQWVLAMDYSQLAGGNPLSGPRWLRQKHTWGPSCWPMHWCEAVKQETLDCGALAALSHEVFKARGVESYPVQLIQQYTEHATGQWHKRWSSHGDELDVDASDARRPSLHWIAGSLIYHEGVAVVLRDDEIKIWDSSAGWWVNPKQSGGYGAALVVRIVAQHGGDAPRSFRWGIHRIATNEWQKVERARTAAAGNF